MIWMLLFLIFLKSQRLKELNDAYVTGDRMNEEMTQSLYDELHAFGSKLKNADFKQAFLGRLEKGRNDGRTPGY